jgi:hypothetical protein
MSQYIKNILIPARLYNYFHNNDILNQYIAEFKRRNPTISEVETWVEIYDNCFEYTMSFRVYCLKKDHWCNYLEIRFKSYNMLAIFTDQSINKLRDSYIQNSRTSIERLLCIREICLQLLILDIYEHIAYWLEMQLPCLRPDFNVQQDDLQLE